ncbi:MAG: glycosyltransferase family 39 protein [Terriglobia bacterium]|jgi:4-amino-4-deoxy-L-arabinose transferase-like glycosyltransferase
MRARFIAVLEILAAFVGLILLHLPLLRLPYFWDESGYYIPAALDFYRSGLLIPTSTEAIGHTPLVMIYLGLAWRLFGYSAWVTRTAMTLIAAGTVATLYALGRRVASREIAAWSALLLALSPLFFAQSTLALVDLAAGLFTTLAVLFLLGDQLWLFALAASLAFLSKETAVVLLPVVWLYAWRKGRGFAAGRPAALVPLGTWGPLVAPLVPLAAWVLYYHHATGYWTGSPGYLKYNLYSTLSPARAFWSLLRRAYELFIGGFNWLLTACALVGIWTQDTGHGTRESGFGNRDTILGTRDLGESQNSCPVSRVPRPVFESPLWRQFLFLAAGLTTVYMLLLSLVGGAVLPRYLLPVLPLFYVAAVGLTARLPRFPARLVLAAAAACFVWAWFINPPYPFPFEDNLAYADFVRLHEQAAHFLETQPGQPRILTAWPATDELTKPLLGYVGRPLAVVRARGFAPQEFADAPADSFDLLYLYSRRWEPPGNWVVRFPLWLRLQGRHFDYHQQVAAEVLVARYRLRLLAEMKRRGQWVRIYSH